MLPHRTAMHLKLLKAKIHRAAVTFTDVNYPGSITLDPLLLRDSGIHVNEAVLVADCETGHRFETYVIPGVVGVNGAAARLTGLGNKVIVLAFGYYEPAEAETHESRVVLVDDQNRRTEILRHKTRIP